MNLCRANLVGAIFSDMRPVQRGGRAPWLHPGRAARFEFADDAGLFVERESGAVGLHWRERELSIAGRRDGPAGSFSLDLQAAVTVTVAALSGGASRGAAPRKGSAETGGSATGKAFPSIPGCARRPFGPRWSGERSRSCCQDWLSGTQMFSWPLLLRYAPIFEEQHREVNDYEGVGVASLGTPHPCARNHPEQSVRG